MLLFLIGLVVGVGITIAFCVRADIRAETVMFNTLRAYDSETGTHYTLVPEQRQAFEPVRTGKASVVFAQFRKSMRSADRGHGRVRAASSDFSIKQQIWATLF